MTYSFPQQKYEFLSISFKGLNNTEMNDGNSNWREPKNTYIFLNSFGEFWIIDRKVNASFERKRRKCFQRKVLASQLFSVNSVKTIINHLNLEGPNCESGLPKQGKRLGLQEMQLRKNGFKAQQGCPLHSALPAAYSLGRAFCEIREKELYILVKRQEQKSCRFFKDIVDYWSCWWVSSMQHTP